MSTTTFLTNAKINWKTTAGGIAALAGALSLFFADAQSFLAAVSSSDIVSAVGDWKPLVEQVGVVLAALGAAWAGFAAKDGGITGTAATGATRDVSVATKTAQAVTKPVS